MVEIPFGYLIVLIRNIIYEKEFHVDLKGYAPAEVDEFLDMVIEDYQKYDEKVEELGAAVTRYEEKIKELQQQLFALQSENENLNEKVNSDFVNKTYCTFGKSCIQSK